MNDKQPNLGKLLNFIFISPKKKRVCYKKKKRILEAVL
jgi:hypothetical protein